MNPWRRGLIAGFLFLGLTLIWPGLASSNVISVEVEDDGSIRLHDGKSDSGVAVLDTAPARTPLLPNREELQQYVARAARKYDLPESLILGVIRAESFGNHEARSKAGAIGLMQLMPSTARGLGVEDPFDPEQNILGGSRYLGRMIQKFDGDLDLALAAYNAGPSRVEEAGGIPDIDETQRYVNRVKKNFDRFEAQDRVVYTYRDEDGRLHITNLRPEEL